MVELDALTTLFARERENKKEETRSQVAYTVYVTCYLDSGSMHVHTHEAAAALAAGRPAARWGGCIHAQFFQRCSVDPSSISAVQSLSATRSVRVVWVRGNKEAYVRDQAARGYFLNEKLPGLLSYRLLA